MLPEKPQGLVAFIRGPGRQSRVGDVITGRGVAIDYVFALVKPAFERNPDMSFFGAAPEKILLFVIEQIKKRPCDRLDYCRLARAVLTRDRGGPPGKVKA